jgi:hypothetical protein
VTLFSDNVPLLKIAPPPVLGLYALSRVMSFSVREAGEFTRNRRVAKPPVRVITPPP